MERRAKARRWGDEDRRILLIALQAFRRLEGLYPSLFALLVGDWVID